MEETHEAQKSSRRNGPGDGDVARDRAAGRSLRSSATQPLRSDRAPISHADADSAYPASDGNGARSDRIPVRRLADSGAQGRLDVVALRALLEPRARMGTVRRPDPRRLPEPHAAG